MGNMWNWIVKTLVSAALGSWKTTACGFVVAVGILLQPVLVSGQVPTKSQIIGACCVALAGFLSKDHDKTGTGGFRDPIRGPDKPDNVDQTNLS